MANLLASIGRAGPAISQSWRDILGTHAYVTGQKREAERFPLEMEERKVGLDISKQQRAITEMTIQNEKQLQEFYKQPWDPKLDPALSTLEPEDQGKMIEQLKSSGFIDPKTGMGTQRGRMLSAKNLVTDKAMADMYADMAIKSSRNKISKIQNQIAEAEDSGNWKKADDLKLTMNNMIKEHDVKVGKMEQFKTMTTMNSQIMALQKTGEWEKMPLQIRVGMEYAAKSGNDAEFKVALGKWTEGMTAEKEANVQTHFETDEKGNTTKIVTNPKTGTTISRENLGKIGKGLKEPDTGKEQRQIGKDAVGMRKEFNALKEVKDYKDIRSKFGVMQKAFEASKTAKNFVAIDQALITLFNKMTDPQSVVRESEYARTPENLAFLNKWQGKLEKIMKGGAGLTQDERQELLSRGSEFMLVYQGLYNEKVNEYKQNAIDSGIPPEMVVRGEGVTRETQTTVRYNVGGKIYEIPSNKVNDFMKDFPNAKKVQ